MPKKSEVAMAAVRVLGAALLCASFTSFAASDPRAERVEVTGSRVKRLEGETASPVQSISREDIERTGVTSVNDLLQHISAAGGGLDDRTSNGIAPGAGGLNLRSLGFNSTLILVNGRRVATYPFAQQVGTSQGFQDLQSLPLGAVDRIEVLKDGASAIYGADAVAGVVNIVLRTAYKGVEAGVNVGRSHARDGNTITSDLTGGVGDLATQGFNLLISLNLAKRDEVRSSNRQWGYTEDLRSQGGHDLRSSYGFPGTLTDTVTGATVDAGGPCGPAAQNGRSGLASGFCRFDRPSQGSMLPRSERAGLYSRANLLLRGDWSAWGELLLTRNRFQATSWPSGTTDDVALGSSVIPSGSPSNPFANDAEVRYRFADLGDRGNQGTAYNSRVVLGTRATLAGFDLEAALNLNQVKVDSLAKNNALVSRVMCLTNPAAAAAYAAGANPLGQGTLNQIFAADPAAAAYFRRELAKCDAAFARYGYYNYVNPAANAAGVADYLRHDSTRQGVSSLHGADVKISRELFMLGGGSAAIAAGAELRQEKVSDTPDEQLSTGDTLSNSSAQAFGRQKAFAAYAELVAPLTRALEVSGALRHDRYTGNGRFSATSPKLGLRFQPVKEVLLRATASSAFRAPSLFETTPAQQAAFAFSIQDPVLCPDIAEAQTNPNCALDPRRVQRGNPDLKPEKSTTQTLGVVFEPQANFSVSVDLWRISRKHEIGAFEDQTLVDLFPTDPRIVVRNGGGEITQINQVPVQLNGTKTSGADVEVRYSVQLSDIGTRLTAKLGGTYTNQYLFTTTDSAGTQVQEEFNGSYNQPRWRSNWEFTLARGHLAVTFSGHATAGYAGLGVTEKVATADITNLGIAYTGIRNLTVSLVTTNVFNRHPSFNDETSGTTAGYNPQLSDPMGRFYRLGFNYKFF